MDPVIIAFDDGSLAEQPVAGIPAAARAARLFAGDNAQVRAGTLIVSAPGWYPSDSCRHEIARLAPGAEWRAVDDAGAAAGMRIDGVALLARDILGRAIDGAAVGRAAQSQVLRDVGEAIVRATGKAGDGIVSRYCNRPVSQRITRVLLRYPSVRPIHATIAAALLGIAMALCLFAGGTTGLVIGALLYQAASIMDGVDGELARATYRTSASGAMLDSLIDAFTNLAFVAGLSFNLYRQGHVHAAIAGAAGMTMMAIGLYLIGARARAAGGKFTFDGVKDHFRARKSVLMQWLTWLTMRDFYAAAATLMVVVGFAVEMLFVFVTVASGWFVVTLSVLLRNPVRQRGTAATTANR